MNFNRHLPAFILLLSFCPGRATAQHISPYSAAQDISLPRFFRFHYDNDFFTGTDKYYSQGITMEYRNPALKNFVASTLLYTPFKAGRNYGISFNLFGYTPVSTKRDSILYSDRPFDGNLSFQLFAVQTDSLHQRQLSSSLSLGVMGPAGLGKEIQTNIHRWTKNPLPHGWEHQVKNDIIINYALNYEKKITGNGNNFLLSAMAEARAGTLDTRIGGGMCLMAGKFNKRFSSGSSSKNSTEFYFYSRGSLYFIGYNASLQGGLFNRSSPYVIAGSNVSRIIFQADAGMVVNFKKLFLSYNQSFLTKEFRTGGPHRWGGLSIGFAF
jgi:hypothetical protein